MSRGRKPLPRAILKLRNSSALRQDRHKRPEPKAADGAPLCPKWLDATGKACWKRITANLKAMGILKTADGEVLAGLAQNWSLFVRASKVLNKMAIDGSYEMRRLSATASDSYKNFLRACEQFGLTPSARTRIDVGIETKQEDELDRLLAGKVG